MKKVLVRVSSFAATAAAALGIFALCRAAPTYPPSPLPAQRAAQAPDFVLAAMNPPTGDAGLADDAAAAGFTGRTDRSPPRSYAPPPRPAPAPEEQQGARALGAQDPIGQLILPPPAEAQRPYAELQPGEPADDAAPPHPVRHRAPRRATPLERGARPPLAREIERAPASEPQRQAEPPPLPHRPLFPHRVHHRFTPRARHEIETAPRHEVEAAPRHEAPAPEGPAPELAPAPPPAHARVRPHRLHIVVEPPRRPALEAQPGAAPVSPTLPEVEAAQPPAPAPVDVSAALDRMTRSAAADMRAARFELSPALSRGHDGAAVVTLPSGLLSQLQADAEDAGLEPEGPLSVTVTLSGAGYGIVPEGARTWRAAPGQPATFTWGISPRSGQGGTLTASMTAVVPVEGEDRSVSLGVLTAQIAPAPAPAPAPVNQSAPAAATAPAITSGAAPDLGSRMREDLRKFGLPEPSQFSLHDLAIPGHPTLDVPLIGETPSEKVVAVGLIVLAFLFIQSLLRGAGVRAQRRRRLAELEDGYFSQGRL